MAPCCGKVLVFLYFPAMGSCGGVPLTLMKKPRATTKRQPFYVHYCTLPSSYFITQGSPHKEYLLTFGKLIPFLAYPSYILYNSPPYCQNSTQSLLASFTLYGGPLVMSDGRNVSPLQRRAELSAPSQFCTTHTSI